MWLLVAYPMNLVVRLETLTVKGLGSYDVPTLVLQLPARSRSTPCAQLDVFPTRGSS